MISVKVFTFLLKAIYLQTISLHVGKRMVKVDVAYRTMRATAQHTLLKVDAPIEAVHLIMPSLRREECLIIGKGRNIPDPIDREGIHMFALEVEGLKGERIMVKTRVPRGILKPYEGW